MSKKKNRASAKKSPTITTTDKRARLIQKAIWNEESWESLIQIQNDD